MLRPMAVFGTTFFVRTIAQSTSAPWAETNTITLTLASSLQIPGGGATIIILGGFVNASVASSTTDADNNPRKAPCSEACSVPPPLAITVCAALPQPLSSHVARISLLR